MKNFSYDFRMIFRQFSDEKEIALKKTCKPRFPMYTNKFKFNNNISGNKNGNLIQCKKCWKGSLIHDYSKCILTIKTKKITKFTRILRNIFYCPLLRYELQKM